jgi:Barrier to autointegration factor
MAGTETTTNAAKNFIENPLKVMGKVTDLPGIGKAAAGVLEPLGIKSSRQLFGLYLQFEDAEDFADFLEGKGIKWHPNQHCKDPRAELLNTLQQKWLVVQVIFSCLVVFSAGGWCFSAISVAHHR